VAELFEASYVDGLRACSTGNIGGGAIRAGLPLAVGAAEAAVDEGAVEGALTAAPPPWKNELKSTFLAGAGAGDGAAAAAAAAAATGLLGAATAAAAGVDDMVVGTEVDGRLPKASLLPGCTWATKVDGAAGDDDSVAEASLSVPKLIAGSVRARSTHRRVAVPRSKGHARAMPTGCFGIVTPSPRSLPAGVTAPEAMPLLTALGDDLKVDPAVATGEATALGVLVPDRALLAA
jgi:hypothetical protein